MKVAWQDHIESAPAVLRGKPCIKGTRIPVGLILGYLAAEKTREQIAACLDYARELADFEAAV